MTELEFFQITYPYVNDRALERVLANNGINNRAVVSPEQLVEFASANPQIWLDYALLVQDAMRGRKWQQDIKSGALDVFTTVGVDGEKKAFDWEGLIDKVIKAGGTAFDFANLFKTGTSATSAAEKQAAAAAEAEKAKQARTTMLIVGGIVGVVLITIIIIIATKKK